ncbi:MAG: VTT domain-containing protein [Bryobacteraceae bacterium]
MGKVVAWLQSWGPAGAVFLAVLDSSGVPLPASVDIMLLLVGAATPKLAMWTAVLSIIGSAVGSMILFGIARKGGQVYLERHAATPRALRFRAFFNRYGLITVFIPALVPLLPLPLKIPVLSAGALGVSPLWFLLTILAARIPRYLGLAWLGSRLGDQALVWLQAHKWHFGLGAAGLLVALSLILRLTEKKLARYNDA